MLGTDPSPYVPLGAQINCWRFCLEQAHEEQLWGSEFLHWNFFFTRIPYFLDLDRAQRPTRDYRRHSSEFQDFIRV